MPASRLAAQLRAERIAANLARTPEERVELAFELGRRALAEYAAFHGVTIADARRVFEETKRRGRRPSRIA